MQYWKGILLPIAFVSATACSLPAQSFVVNSTADQLPAGATTPVSDPRALCSRLSEIKQLSRDGEPIEDPVYKAFVDVGEAVLPCLIDNISDTTRMKDPRGIPGPTDTRVGDVAYFVFVRISNVDFVELLPAKVQEKYKTEGVYAYHAFVSERRNRLQLQAKLREWHKEKYAAKNRP